MIFMGGGGLGVVLLLFVLLLLVGGGDAMPLIFLIAFFALPFLVIRSILRSFSSGRSRSFGGPFFGGMVHTRVLGQPTVPWAGGGGWSPQPAPPLPRWQAPQQPVLPAVTAADVTSLRDRLGSDVRTLDPGQDPVARQALADAAERLSTASALLERASSDAQLRTAWLATVEGLQAARVARGRLGLDAGPPIPTLPTVGPPLTSHQQVQVGGRTHVGAPSYEPGRPHWFPGGQYGDRYVPGGWYDAPFWPSALLLGTLGGWVAGSVLAGSMAGAMYGEDLGLDETGWDGGSFEDGVDGGGGDWGGDGGGGDWGSGDGWGDSGDGGGFGDGFGGDGDWGGFGGGGGWGGGDGGFDGGDFGGDW